MPAASPSPRSEALNGLARNQYQLEITTELRRHHGNQIPIFAATPYTSRL